jgi:hypothetical protein
MLDKSSEKSFWSWKAHGLLRLEAVELFVAVENKEWKLCKRGNSTAFATYFDSGSFESIKWNEGCLKCCFGVVDE